MRGSLFALHSCGRDNVGGVEVSVDDEGREGVIFANLVLLRIDPSRQDLIEVDQLVSASL